MRGISLSTRGRRRMLWCGLRLRQMGGRGNVLSSQARTQTTQMSKSWMEWRVAPHAPHRTARELSHDEPHNSVTVILVRRSSDRLPMEIFEAGSEDFTAACVPHL